MKLGKQVSWDYILEVDVYNRVVNHRVKNKVGIDVWDLVAHQLSHVLYEQVWEQVRNRLNTTI